MNLLDWIRKQETTIHACAKAWEVSTLNLIARGKVLASLHNARRIIRGTGGAVSIDDLCAMAPPPMARPTRKPPPPPDPLIVTEITRAPRKRKRAGRVTRTRTERGSKAVAS